MASHAGHNHPATPAARATCRKFGLDPRIRIEADGATGAKAPVIRAPKADTFTPEVDASINRVVDALDKAFRNRRTTTN
jgi:hypothetical protein